jgi:hypothetical protein
LWPDGRNCRRHRPVLPYCKLAFILLRAVNEFLW